MSKVADWSIIEKDYRAGRKSLRTIADEHGVTEGAIRKRAKRDLWSRDLDEKIRQRTQEKVRKQVVRKAGTQVDARTEKEVVERYSDAAASVDEIQRDDVKLAIDNSRSQLSELVTLGDPKFREALEGIAEAFDESGPTPNGGWKTDKNNELYRYIISLAGRVRMAKEIAASHGVYLPLQRKIFGLDVEKKSVGEFEEMLRRVQLTED